MCKDGHDARALSKSQRAEWYSQGATYGYCDELLERVKPTDSPDIPRNGYVYMSPHQDDEALFYGAEIMDKTRRGIPVTVVLMGLGDKAPGCRTLGLKGEACTKQRDREFTTSVRRMHATPVILKTRFHDVEARATEIAKLMKPWVDAGNEMHTLTQYDSHPDHSNLGFGLADNHGTKSHWHVKNTDELATKPVPYILLLAALRRLRVRLHRRHVLAAGPQGLHRPRPCGWLLEHLFRRHQEAWRLLVTRISKAPPEDARRRSRGMFVEELVAQRAANHLVYHQVIPSDRRAAASMP